MNGRFALVAGLIGLLGCQNGQAQFMNLDLILDNTTVSSVVNSLLLESNAQTMGFGGIGVVSSDLYVHNGLNQNPAALTKGYKSLGIQQFNYHAMDYNLAQGGHAIDFGLHTPLGIKNALGILFRRYRSSEIVFTDENGTDIQTFIPNEVSASMRYSRLLTDNLSVGIGLDFFQSDLSGSTSWMGTYSNPIQGGAVDIGIEYRKPLISKERYKAKWVFGLGILNLGSKKSYFENNTLEFLPQMLEVGNMITSRLRLVGKSYVAIDLAYQAEKLLVPSRPEYHADDPGQIAAGRDPNITSFQAVYQSFYDAPGQVTYEHDNDPSTLDQVKVEKGSVLREELHEISHRFGAETRLNMASNRVLVAIRAGHLAQHQSKRAYQILAYGVGVGFFGFRIDATGYHLYRQGNSLNSFLVSVGANFTLGDGDFFKFKER
jgi:hypothetical protein